MEKLFKFLEEHGVKAKKDEVTAVTLNDATIYVYIKDDSLKIEIEPHDKKVNVDVDLEEVLGSNPYKQ